MEFSPRNFLKRRRPEQFSDSKLDTNLIISRPVLETYLLNLTHRNEQDIFEEFCRQLAEKEIAPNIKPNTGPAGGGDGKTDAESYPVSKETASGWILGYESILKNENLAFAFSAKVDWKTKVKGDVKSIMTRNKEFHKVYFFTNQYAKSKERKKIEDDL